MRKLSVVVAALCVFVGIGAAAQTVPTLLLPRPKIETSTAMSPDGQGAALTPADAEAWLDGFMPFALRRGDVAGATVAIVKDGQILLQKGYGYSDVERRTPVVADRTVFRPGSIAKLFTWTAVMQLVEQGKLDLDADVNRYLDFEIPPLDGKPITMRNIMTHTAGFEETLRDLMTSNVEKVGLEKAVKRWQPKRVYAPGTTPAYSNYATALAGYIVQRISRQPYELYVEQHILAPLGMRNSSFRQPLPAPLMRNMSKAYSSASEAPKPYEYVPFAPAGSLAATGSDMARFMIAHLQGGALGSARILKPETVRAMHRTPLKILPPLNSMVLGFFENNVNGRRVVSHSGDTQLFHSELNLFVDDGVGLYISMNSSGDNRSAGAIRSAFFAGFADRYFPAPEPADSVSSGVDPKVAVRHAGMVAGAYENSRRAHSTFLGILNFLGQVKIEEDGKGGITVPAFMGIDGEPKRYREIAPFLWQEIGGDNRLAVKIVDGKGARFSIDNASPIMVFDRAPFSRSTAWLSPAVYAALGALLLTILSWPVSALVRRRFAAPAPFAGSSLRAHRAVRIFAILAVAAVAGWMLTLNAALSSAGSPAGIETRLVLMSGFTLLAFAGGLLVALWNAWKVFRGKRLWFAKSWSVALVLAFGVLLWLAAAFNLLNFSTNF